jgi:ABC-2 type transport system permease protein
MSATATTASTASASARTRPLPVLRRTLADSWRSTIGWAVGLAAAVSMYLPLFPSIGGAEMAELIESLPAEMVNTLGYDEIGTGAGYAQGTFYGLIGFVLLTIAACAWGATAIAGAEETGRLELTLAHGVSRTQYALESAVAILVRLVLLVGLSLLLVLAYNEPSELELEPGNIVAASAALLGLIMLIASVALAVGALTGRRAAGLGAGAGVAVVGYVLNAIGNQNDDLEWLHSFSPYDWAYANTPLRDGADWGGLTLLGAGVLLAIAVATVALRRRDVTG